MCLSFKQLIASGIRPYPKVAFVQSRVENVAQYAVNRLCFLIWKLPNIIIYNDLD